VNLEKLLIWIGVYFLAAMWLFMGTTVVVATLKFWGVIA